MACNGAETCDPSFGCRSGTPVDCDDGTACTTDTCVEPGGTCTNLSRPIQNTTVASVIKTPGTPKATDAPKRFNRGSAKRIEARAPTLIEK